MRVLLCLCVSSKSCLLSGTGNARQDLGHILDFVTRLKHLKVAGLVSCLIVSKGIPQDHVNVRYETVTFIWIGGQRHFVWHRPHCLMHLHIYMIISMFKTFHLRNVKGWK